MIKLFCVIVEVVKCNSISDVPAWYQHVRVPYRGKQTLPIYHRRFDGSQRTLFKFFSVHSGQHPGFPFSAVILEYIISSRHPDIGPVFFPPPVPQEVGNGLNVRKKKTDYQKFVRVPL